jgi:hypothetical protein
MAGRVELAAGCLLLGLSVYLPQSAQAAKPVSARRQAACWHVRETANFRILSFGSQPVSAATGEACEQLRSDLCQSWVGSSELADWSPKCDLVLHPNDASYLKEVGRGGQTTIASSLVDQRQGNVRTRRVDIRSIDSPWEVAALPHELTHVILGGHFAGRTLPRWIDEGVAILADPVDKRLRHQDELLGALSRRSAFRVVELLTLDDYPAADRWGTFYGQSASIVEFLVAEKSPADFVKFVRLSFEQGYDASLREVYAIDGIGDLERRWNAHANLGGARVMRVDARSNAPVLRQPDVSQHGPAAGTTIDKVALAERKRP